MTNVETTIKNPVSDKLKKFVVDLVKTTKKEELNIAKQGIELRNILVEYMQKDKTGLKKTVGKCLFYAILFMTLQIMTLPQEMNLAWLLKI